MKFTPQMSVLLSLGTLSGWQHLRCRNLYMVRKPLQQQVDREKRLEGGQESFIQKRS